MAPKKKEGSKVLSLPLCLAPGFCFLPLFNRLFVQGAALVDRNYYERLELTEVSLSLFVSLRPSFRPSFPLSLRLSVSDCHDCISVQEADAEAVKQVTHMHLLPPSAARHPSLCLWLSRFPPLPLLRSMPWHSAA